MKIKQVKLLKIGNSHGILVPLVYQDAMKIKQPLKTRFEILTDGQQIILRRLKK